MLRDTQAPFRTLLSKTVSSHQLAWCQRIKERKTRLIFHLFFPKTGKSVNSEIPNKLCSVKYPDFDEAVKLCVGSGVGCHIAKSDMFMAFRNVPLSKKAWKALVLKAEHSVTGKVWFFFDKCLPFGSSVSCKIFQDFSNSVAFLVQHCMQHPLVNYLDNYFFTALLKAICDSQVQAFLDICHTIGFPVSLEKTYWGTTCLVFLGLLIDTVKQAVCIPTDKVEKAINLIEFFLNKVNKKVTVLQVQKLCGSLNFLCKCVVPG